MAQVKVGVVDYGSGNLRSVAKAFEACDAEVSLVCGLGDLDLLDALVVPGVGSFGDCAGNLRRSGLWEPVRDWILADRPFFGICLGYQLLFESSEESPGVEGLGIFGGSVRKIMAPGLKVPHMGWNSISVLDAGEKVFEGLGDAPTVYFVHSFIPVPDDAALIAATCDYGGEFAAAIGRGRLVATQFHPEKSQTTGLRIIRNFLTQL